MTKLQKSKKGFTLTELAIVIAVIAILIAVLVPTFVSLINKANESNDKQLVKNLNTALSTEEITDGKATTMSEALVIAADNGYNVDKLTPSSSGDIVWDQESNRFLLIDEDGNIVYKDDTTSSDVLDTKFQLWYIATSATKVAEKEYSYYLDYETTAVTAVYSIDAGDNESVDVNLTNTTSLTSDSGNVALASKKLTATTSSATPAIRVNLNGGSLTVSSASIGVEIYGTVTGNVYLEKGSVEITSTATVSVVVVTASSASEVSLTNTSTTTVTVVATEQAVVEKLSDVVVSGSSELDTTTKYDTITLSYFAGGLGTESSPYIINSIDNWLNFRNKGYADDGLYWSVTCDLDFSTTTSCVDIEEFTGTIDFNGNTVSGIKLANCENIYYSCYGGLFYNVIGESTIANLCYQIQNLDTDIAVRPVHYVGYNKDNTNVTLSNVTVTGEVVYTDNNASTFVFALYGNNTSLTYKNCTNYANISNTGMTGIFMGQIMKYTGWNITFENCENYGNIQSTSNFASMLISNSYSFTGNSISSTDITKYITVQNCVNYGNIYGATNANLLCGGSDYNTIASNLDIVNLQSGVCMQLAVTPLASTNNVFNLSTTTGADHYTLTFSACLKSSDGEKWGTYILYEYTFNSDEELSAATVYAYEFKDFNSSYKLSQISGTSLYTTTISNTTYYVVNYATSGNGNYYLNGNSVSVTLCAYAEDGTLQSVQSATLANAE